MRPSSLPTIDTRYWVAISLASVFGANLGDFVSHVLHLGHVRGLPVLALGFAAVLLAERRSAAGREGFYWTAIVILRTAATNLADLATHDLRLGYGGVVGVLAFVLAGLCLIQPRRDRIGAGPCLPRADVWYWAAMLTAGTLGTAIGDAVAGPLGLGTGGGSLLLGAVLLGTLCVAGRRAATTRRGYWSCVVAVRSAGTTAGDFLVGAGGLGLGLPLGTAVSGLALLTMVGWPRQGYARSVTSSE